MDSFLDLQPQVLVSTDIAGQFWNVCVWDYSSGSSLQTYKNSSTVQHGLAFLKQDYMLCAAYNKPYIVTWNLKGKPQSTKINTSGCVTCIATTKCGNYFAIGIEEKVFILQTYAGKILNVLSKHLQNITCIKFSSNDRHLITSSDDATILVWEFHEVLTTEKEFLKPIFNWNAHSMKINDLYVSHISNRVISASADQTCKVWSLSNESSFPVQSLLFQAAPNRCLFDHLETNLYVGLVNGVILAVSIKTIIQESEKLIKDSMENKSFIGHSQKINCLSITMDDSVLASGSDDCTIRIWDTFSKQCIKLINQNGSITNLEFKLRTVFFNEQQNIVPSLFSRYLPDSDELDSVTVITNKQKNHLTIDDFINDSFSENACSEEYFELKSKYETMKKINDKMYNFALKKILN